jgi:hypothetical protein
MPIDKLPDDVKINTEFKLTTYIGDIEKTGSFYV